MAFIFKSIQRLVINLRPPCCAWFWSHFHYPECPYSSNLSSVGFASVPALLRKPSGCFLPLQLVFLSLFIVSFLPTFCSGHFYLSHMSKTQNNYRRVTKSCIGCARLLFCTCRPLKMKCSETRRSSVLKLLFDKFPVNTNIRCVVFSLLTAPALHTPPLL